jgi:hypothetical protein
MQFLFQAASPETFGYNLVHKCLLGSISLGVKRPGREADLSRSSRAEVKSAWSYTSAAPSTPSWRGTLLSTRITLSLLLPLKRLKLAQRLTIPESWVFFSGLTHLITPEILFYLSNANGVPLCEVFHLIG